MASSDYNKYKNIEVTDDGGSNPTISPSRVYALRIVSGSNSTTGTGDIEIDDSNVDGKEDIAIYNSDGSSVETYYWERFDTTNGVYLAHVVTSSLTRDNTVRFRTYFGSGSTDESSAVESVFDAANGLGARYALDETSGATIDSTSNNNDSTSTTGTTYNVDSELNGGRQGDGSDDTIRIPDGTGLKPTDKLSVLGIANMDTYGKGALAFKQAPSSGGEDYVLDFETGTDKGFRWIGRDSSNNILFDIKYDDSNWDATVPHVYAAVYDSNNSLARGWIDKTIVGEDTSAGTAGLRQDGGDLALFERVGPGDFLDGILDEIRVYSAEVISDDFVRAFTDMTPQGGQVLFSQQAATDNVTTNSTTGTFDAAIENLDNSLNATVDTVTQHRQNGIVDLDGTVVSGAHVLMHNITQGITFGHTTTDSNGYYEFNSATPGDLASGDKIMLAVYYEDPNDGDDFGQVKVTVV